MELKREWELEFNDFERNVKKKRELELNEKELERNWN